MNQSRPPYNVVLDLSAARDRAQIVPPGDYVAQVVVTILTAGVELRLHRGVTADGIALAPTDAVTYFDPWGGGLYVSHPAQAGETAELAIVPGGA